MATVDPGRGESLCDGAWGGQVVLGELVPETHGRGGLCPASGRRGCGALLPAAWLGGLDGPGTLAEGVD